MTDRRGPMVSDSRQGKIQLTWNSTDNIIIQAVIWMLTVQADGSPEELRDEV